MEIDIKIDASWTLFLDRDGTINRRLPGRYVQFWEEFEFLEGALEGLYSLGQIFDKIIVVTNQQGIDKGIMTVDELNQVHSQMIREVEKAGGRIDNVYYCPHLDAFDSFCRKPNPGMAIQAQADYPEIDFSRSFMVGDMPSDISFGNRLGMISVLITNKFSEKGEADYVVKDLKRLASYLQ